MSSENVARIQAAASNAVAGRARLVILESPFAGNVPRNIRYGQACLRDSLLRGEAPIASHLLYTQEGVLDDTVAQERTLGIEAGLAWRTVAEASVVYQDFGLSSGMKYGIQAAQTAGRTVEFRNLPQSVLDEIRRQFEA